MVIEKESQKRVDLVKKINKYIEEGSGLQNNIKKADSITIQFDEFQKRIMIPNEAEGFVLSTQTIKQLF